MRVRCDCGLRHGCEQPVDHGCHWFEKTPYAARMGSSLSLRDLPRGANGIRKFASSRKLVDADVLRPVGCEVNVLRIVSEVWNAIVQSDVTYVTRLSCFQAALRELVLLRLQVDRACKLRRPTLSVGT
jgi:hypothetical protein